MPVGPPVPADTALLLNSYFDLKQKQRWPEKPTNAQEPGELS